MFEINSDEVDELMKYHHEEVEFFINWIAKKAVIPNDNRLTHAQYHAGRILKLEILKKKYRFERVFWPGESVI